MNVRSVPRLESARSLFTRQSEWFPRRRIIVEQMHPDRRFWLTTVVFRLNSAVKYFSNFRRPSLVRMLQEHVNRALNSKKHFEELQIAALTQRKEQSKKSSNRFWCSFERSQANQLAEQKFWRPNGQSSCATFFWITNAQFGRHFSVTLMSTINQEQLFCKPKMTNIDFKSVQAQKIFLIREQFFR